MRRIGRGLRLAIIALFVLPGVVILAWAILYFGFYLGYGNWKVRGHQEFATNGLAQIQPAAEMDRLFEDCRHYIVYSGRDSVSTWNATAFFGDRYMLTMQVPVSISSSTSGHVIGDPAFVLNEVRDVSVSPSGQVGASFSRDLKFGPKEWNDLYASKGDFKVIGFSLNPKPVPDFHLYTSASRR